MILQLKLDMIAIGNLNVDLIGKVKKLPARDEKLLLEEFAMRPGGGAANFAAACSKLGLKSGFIGCVGNDEFGKELLANLKRHGVDTSRIKIVDAPTGLVIAPSTAKGNHFLLAHRGANLSLKSEDISSEYISGTKLLHASSVTPDIAITVGSGPKSKEFDLPSTWELSWLSLENASCLTS